VKALESLSRHVQDERLLDAYLAARHCEPIDPPVAEHLADCGACGARYQELALIMDALRAEGGAEADAVFTPERLRQQHQQIARRIEQVGRAARIISFPGQFVRRTMTSSSSSPAAPRWVAAAAVAGLFIGVALGASYGWGAHGARALPGDMRLRPVATQGTDPVDVAADDAFLSELELALARPHTRELLAFDALTPHVREIRDNR
jgi:anti-sigma factor RsiW